MDEAGVGGKLTIMAVDGRGKFYCSFWYVHSYVVAKAYGYG